MAVKSLKLTNEKRDQILKNVMDHWIKNNPFLFEGEKIDVGEYCNKLNKKIGFPLSFISIYIVFIGPLMISI